MTTSFTVFFDDPFWVGVAERDEGGVYVYSRIVFGAEPTMPQLYQFMLTQYNELQFCEVATNECILTPVKMTHPKRMARQLGKGRGEHSLPKKSLDLIKEELKKRKGIRKRESALKKEKAKEEQYALRAAKKARKKRGH